MRRWSGRTLAKDAQSFHWVVQGSHCDVFRNGNDDKVKNRITAMMQNILILRNSMRYNKPSSHHITAFLHSILRKMKSNGKIRILTADISQATRRRLLVPERHNITPSTETTNVFGGGGGGRSGRVDTVIAHDEAVHALQSVESEDYASDNGGRRGMVKICTPHWQHMPLR